MFLAGGDVSRKEDHLSEQHRECDTKEALQDLEPNVIPVEMVLEPTSPCLREGRERGVVVGFLETLTEIKKISWGRRVPAHRPQDHDRDASNGDESHEAAPHPPVES